MPPERNPALDPRGKSASIPLVRRAPSRTSHTPLPALVSTELEAYFRRGILGHGFTFYPPTRRTPRAKPLPDLFNSEILRFAQDDEWARDGHEMGTRWARDGWHELPPFVGSPPPQL